MASFDHLVGGHEQGLWHGDAETLGSLKVDHELVFRRLLKWQFAGLFTSIWWVVILAVGFASVKGALRGGAWSRIRSLMGLLFLVPFVGAGVLIPATAWAAGAISPVLKIFAIAAALLAMCNLLFYWLLKAPTRQGRGTLDQIEGFRMYMTTAEEERLKVLHPPEKTPALFERDLPYAMALDCENEWNNKFSSILAAAAAAGAVGAIGGWYYGSGGFNSRNFGQDLGSSLTSSISSSGVAPGSTSGSSGGGSSGGGGGGGGGSGW